MQIHKVNDTFNNLVDALEFYKLFYGHISKFKSLDYNLVLKWEKPFRVYGQVYIDGGSPITLEGLLKKIDL